MTKNRIEIFSMFISTKKGTQPRQLEPPFTCDNEPLVGVLLFRYPSAQ
jgi:hypothetical protein